METENTKRKKYELKDPDSTTVEEPLLCYGNAVLDLDETKRYTYADYLTWWDDKRRELINGFIRMMLPAASTRHASISGELVYIIKSFIKKNKGKCKLFDAPFDVRLPNKKGETADDKVHTVVQPDICLICDPSKLDERGCVGTPDLVIEIASKSNRRYDETEKLETYESAGVPEYWIVSPKEEAVTVYLLQSNGKYAQGIKYELDAKVPVHALKGLEINLEEIFGEFSSSSYY